MEERFKSVQGDGNGGGGLTGYITCSYADLVKVLGPASSADGYKTSTEWTVEDTETGDVFTLYDYKETSKYSPDLPSVRKFRALPSHSWHIGGRCDIGAFGTWLAEKLERVKVDMPAQFPWDDQKVDVTKNK